MPGHRSVDFQLAIWSASQVGSIGSSKLGDGHFAAPELVDEVVEPCCHGHLVGRGVEGADVVLPQDGELGPHVAAHLGGSGEANAVAQGGSLTARGSSALRRGTRG